MASAATNIRLIDSICTEPLDLTPISSLLLFANPFNFHAFYESLGDIRGFHPFFDLYCAHLEGMLREIM